MCNMEWPGSPTTFISLPINIGMNDSNYGWTECSLDRTAIAPYQCDFEKDVSFDTHFSQSFVDMGNNSVVDITKTDFGELIKTDPLILENDDDIQNYHIDSIVVPEQLRNILYDDLTDGSIEKDLCNRIAAAEVFGEENTLDLSQEQLPFYGYTFNADLMNNAETKRSKQENRNNSPNKSKSRKEKNSANRAGTSGSRQQENKRQTKEIITHIDNDNKLNNDVENMAKKIFSKKTRTLLRWLNSGVNPKDIKAIMNKMWTEMTDEQKKPFYLEAGATDKIISLKLAYMNDSDNFKQNSDLLMTTANYTKRAARLPTFPCESKPKSSDLELELALEDLFHSEKSSKEWASFENDKDRYLKNQNIRQEEVIQMRESRQVKRFSPSFEREGPQYKKMKINDILGSPSQFDIKDNYIQCIDDESTEESLSDSADSESVHQIYSKFESSPEKSS